MFSLSFGIVFKNCAVINIFLFESQELKSESDLWPFTWTHTAAAEQSAPKICEVAQMLLWFKSQEGTAER